MPLTEAFLFLTLFLAINFQSPKRLFTMNKLFACASLLLCGSGVNAGWNPGRVHHVDAVGQAHLFRGPAPVSSDVFVFDDMRTTLQVCACVCVGRMSVRPCVHGFAFCVRMREGA